MYRISLTFALLAIVSALTVGPAVTVQNLRLFYGSSEYFVKGMAYSPSPLAKVVENQNWGTGLCTPKRAYTPGSYTIQMTSPCLLEDYFDGTVYPGGPAGGWWNGVWQRDFPLIQSLGVNTLRIYHADPITSLAVSNNPSYTDKTVIGSNHIPFLDLALSYGFKVVFPLYGDESAVADISQSMMFQYIENIIDEVGYHPAVLMYQFGNELQFLNNDNSYVAKINSYLSHARSYQLSRWGRPLPVSTALIDYPPYYNSLVPALDIDIITTNAGYRGFNFQNLWSGDGNTFSGLKSLSCQTGRPTLIGEMGVHSGQPSSVPFDVPTILPSMMSDLIAHKTSGAIGGFYFEWQEEHWKGIPYVGYDWTQGADVFMGAVRLQNGTGQFPIDIAVKKTGGAYDWSAAVQAFALSPWSQDGPNTLGQTSNNFCTGVATRTTGLTAVPSTASPVQTTSAPVNVNPAPAPNAACGGQPSCNGQCFSTSYYTCTVDGVTKNSVLCYGTSNVGSCNGQCYSTNTYTCINGGLVYGVVQQPVPSTSNTPRTSSTTTSSIPSTSSAPRTTSSTTSSVPRTTTSTSAVSQTSAGAPTCSGNFNCGGALCCPDARMGNVCYGSNNGACVVDGFNNKVYLCGYGGGSCNGNCYDARSYTCNRSNGVITQK